MKKYLILIILVLALVLTACGQKPQTEEMDAETEEKYIEMSKENIKLFNDDGFGALDDKYSEEMKEAITEDTIKSAEEVIGEKGSFKDFGQGAAFYYTDEATSSKFIVSQVEALYENGSLLFNINYDQDDNIIGLFMK